MMKIVVSAREWIDIADYVAAIMGDEVSRETMAANFVVARTIRQDVTVIEPGPPIEPCPHGWIACDRCPRAFCPTERQARCPHDRKPESADSGGASTAPTGT